MTIVAAAVVSRAIGLIIIIFAESMTVVAAVAVDVGMPVVTMLRHFIVVVVAVMVVGSYFIIIGTRVFFVMTLGMSVGISLVAAVVSMDMLVIVIAVVFLDILMLVVDVMMGGIDLIAGNFTSFKRDGIRDNSRRNSRRNGSSSKQERGGSFELNHFRKRFQELGRLSLFR